ncbi:MAG: hypothetical protein Ct9H300mP30_4610 [Methanobacteriota archaeon]|nr:MAG: hypothetical protein Ct9H300mP30_4610 [Euryarchaeota archaeon]
MLAAVAAFLWRFTGHLLGEPRDPQVEGAHEHRRVAIAIAVLVSMGGDAVLWELFRGILGDDGTRPAGEGRRPRARAQFAIRLERRGPGFSHA